MDGPCMPGGVISFLVVRYCSNPWFEVYIHLRCVLSYYKRPLQEVGKEGMGDKRRDVSWRVRM